MDDKLCQQLAQAHEMEYIQYSGHFFAQMGDVYDCVDLPYDSSYYMANLINNRTHANATMYLGLCLPSVCSEHFIRETLNKQLANISVPIQQMLGFPLAVGSVDVNPQDYVWEKSGWFYLTMVILSLLAVMGVFALWRSMRG